MSNQPPYPLHESVLDRIDPEYAAFYNKHIIDKQQVHLQPVEASRSSGILIPGSGPLQPVASTIDYAIKPKDLMSRFDASRQLATSQNKDGLCVSTTTVAAGFSAR
ncbi:hypothetical protein LB505_012175 [Fusarium chuoi]|nr:hypothetical protein LB505_012175 [Fusarium chuoi]